MRIGEAEGTSCFLLSPLPRIYHLSQNKESLPAEEIAPPGGIRGYVAFKNPYSHTPYLF